ncbi:PDZ and LIM domain protein 7 isoform X3 [Polypterus senegalus]|uniref:PDZ and LIM domain protein 7 isoform X3 n=1 Tax=Polypterus senegalus TaxID=55291 RepID=UPI0019651970|nr:PDZ and LIM domain protein 7 isoform X3 [Polypterus senegalus]
MDLYSVTLEGPAPWGFRLQGGKDFNMPLTVSRLTPGGKAAQQNVGVGDWVVSIDGVNAEGLTHVEAQNKIKACTDSLSLTLSRAFHPTAASKKDMHADVAPQPKYSFESSMSLNKMARPFGEVSSSPGSLTKPVSSALKFNPLSKVPGNVLQQHNGRTEVQQPQSYVPQTEHTFYEELYPESKHSLRMESVPCFIPNDASKKRLIEDTQDWQPRTGTSQSRSFRILAQLTGTDFMQDPDDENLKKSREKFLTEIQSPRYARLRDWHHDRSARALNIKS